jgi:hypothetical protein
LFHYAPGREGIQAGSLYAGIKVGAVRMSDGYEVYNAIAETNGLTHLGCWAHARCYFIEAEAAIPKAARGPEQPATQFVAAIGELCAIRSDAAHGASRASSPPAIRLALVNWTALSGP